MSLKQRHTNKPEFSRKFESELRDPDFAINNASFHKVLLAPWQCTFTYTCTTTSTTQNICLACLSAPGDERVSSRPLHRRTGSLPSRWAMLRFLPPTPVSHTHTHAGMDASCLKAGWRNPNVLISHDKQRQGGH